MWWSVVIVSRITSWVSGCLFEQLWLSKNFADSEHYFSSQIINHVNTLFFCWNLFDIFTTFTNLNLIWTFQLQRLPLFSSAPSLPKTPITVRMDGFGMWDYKATSLWLFWFFGMFLAYRNLNFQIFFVFLLLQIDCCQEGHGGRGHCYFFSMEQVQLILIWNWYGTGTSDMELIWKRHWYDVMEKVLIWNRYWYDLFFHN